MIDIQNSYFNFRLKFPTLFCISIVSETRGRGGGLLWGEGGGGGGVPGQVEREMGSDLETGAGDLAAGSGPDLTEWLGPLSQTERLEAAWPLSPRSRRSVMAQ